jgi:2-methylisocitrate lyase-like PEP mutase family enzyme
MGDALPGIVWPEQCDAVPRGVVSDLSHHAGDVGIGDVMPWAAGGNVVVSNGEGEAGLGNGRTALRQLAEGMEGAFVHKMAVDPQQRLAILVAQDFVSCPDLVKEGPLVVHLLVGSVVASKFYMVTNTGAPQIFVECEHMADAENLRYRLARKPIVVAPGVYDALTALLAAQAGFSTLYISGAAIAYTRLGRPDIGLIGMTEVADTLTAIRDRVEAHLIVDADTAYGNALNASRMVRWFERMGAAAIQFEDQTFPKRCGHLDGKTVIPADEMCGKIRAAVDARHSRETLLIARTDALAVEGIDRAIERAALYREAGADVLFVEAPKTRDDLARIPAALGPQVTTMANMVEGGKTPMLAAAELEAIGFSLVIFPGGIVRALARTAGDYYASLAACGTTEPFRGRMLDFEDINRVVGTAEMIELGKQYDRPAPPGPVAPE